MRFTTSRALDSIERRLTTDPVLAAAVVDLASVVRHTGLDDGRPANLLRLGMTVDALARHLSDDSVAVYPVADRQLLSDLELTSNEKMVIRRWADDGLAEAVPDPDMRALEIAELAGLPLVSRRDYGAYRRSFPDLVGTARQLVPMPGVGGAVLDPGGRPAAAPQPGTHPALRRRWRCPDPDCPLFGSSAGAAGAQPPPSLPQGRPVCPRHGHPLSDTGPGPQVIPVVVVVRGSGRHRFVVREDRPVVVGRNPDAPGVSVGRLLDESSASVVSRNHLRMEVQGGALAVVDTSTNGTVVLSRTAAGSPPGRIRLTRGERRPLGEWDTVELNSGVELADARHWRGSGGVDTSSTLAEAPTMAMRLPPRH